MSQRDRGVGDEAAALTLRPIGVVRSPYHERMSAPRQPDRGAGIEGTLELFPASGIEHALLDLDSFRFIWVLFWFHLNPGFHPKVLPPRSPTRRGVFATRSPYRPNPIGLSPVELLGIDGRVLRVKNLDILDGTPILDLKPYLPYTDSIPDASSGWLDTAAPPEDPILDHTVEFTPLALEQLAFLESRAVTIRPHIEDVLRLGAYPHPYRRIKPKGDAWVLAYKAWRIGFSVAGRNILVTVIHTGYRASALALPAEPEVALHREFTQRFS
jgi:tRNA-Thr(GGU) m(6)t(6)A37 methyltransferase TsaA